MSLSLYLPPCLSLSRTHTHCVSLSLRRGTVGAAAPSPVEGGGYKLWAFLSSDVGPRLSVATGDRVLGLDLRVWGLRFRV